MTPHLGYVLGMLVCVAGVVVFTTMAPAALMECSTLDSAMQAACEHTASRAWNNMQAGIILAAVGGGTVCGQYMIYHTGRAD